MEKRNMAGVLQLLRAAENLFENDVPYSRDGMMDDGNQSDYEAWQVHRALVNLIEDAERLEHVHGL